MPPHLEWVHSQRLVQSEPLCYEFADPAAAQGNRIEATVYLDGQRSGAR